VIWSVAPPAAQGTMMVTGLVGFQVVWARPRPGARQATASTAAQAGAREGRIMAALRLFTRW